MCRPARLLLPVLFLLASRSETATIGLDLDRCTARPTAPERTECLGPFLSAPETEERALSALEKLIEEDPAGVQRVSASVAARAGGNAKVALQARLLTLEGRALMKLGKNVEAEAKLEAAIALDDGTTRMRWLGAEGAVRWSQALDVGESRLEWAARSLLGTGKKEEARALLAREIGLGATGWPVDEGWRLAGGGALPAGESSRAPVTVPRWFERLPDLKIRLLDGGEFRSDSALGKVLLLDFWASWCGPCAQELPHLKALYEAEKQNGLVGLAVNADEPVRVVRDASRAFDLHVPIALYDTALDKELQIRVLPTVILVDRQGRLRARFDGYRPGLESAIAETARNLLGEDREGSPRSVGEWIEGRGRLEAWWARELSSTVGGAAIVRKTGAKPQVAVTAESQLILFDADGENARRTKSPATAGRLLPADLDHDGSPELIAFRPAGTEITVFETARGIYRTFAARAPVLDAAYLEGTGGAEGRLVLATADGPQLVDPKGIEAHPAEGPAPSTGVAVTGEPGSQEIVVLGPEGEIRWLDSSGRTRTKASVPEESFRLLAGATRDGGAGIAPQGVVAGTVGRFFGPGSSEAALATSAGQLVILDLADGRVRARMRWPGITALAAGDLDGDLKDDLLVVWDRSIAALRAAEPAAPR